MTTAALATRKDIDDILAVIANLAETMHNEFSKRETKHDSLDTNVHTIQADVHTLQVDVHTLQADVHTLQVDVHTLKTDVADIKSELTELRQSNNRILGMMDAFFGRLQAVEEEQVIIKHQLDDPLQNHPSL